MAKNEIKKHIYKYNQYFSYEKNCPKKLINYYYYYYILIVIQNNIIILTYILQYLYIFLNNYLYNDTIDKINKKCRVLEFW